MPATAQTAIAVIGIDIGKDSFHVVGLDNVGAIVLRQKWSRGQVETRFANLPPCLIGMEVCVGAHHLSRKLKELGLAGSMANMFANPLRRLHKYDIEATSFQNMEPHLAHRRPERAATITKA